MVPEVSAVRCVYWANAMFSEADRDFNAKCARRLREAGYKVTLPQEACVNVEKEPSAAGIFRIDTAAILDSDAVIACLDQECIDSGVATEIGVAYAFGVPMIGFYTDIRRTRVGRGRMYKNLYVLGAVEEHGRIVVSLDELLEALPAVASGQRAAGERLTAHYGRVARGYDAFVERLESWYQPPFIASDVISSWVRELKPRRVLEIGCGTGATAARICRDQESLSYVGFDLSAGMVEVANARLASDRCSFTTDFDSVTTLSGSGPFDLVLALFTLHDHADPKETLRGVRRCLRSSGHLGIMDLSQQDLPGLTEHLRRGLARPALCANPRLSAAWLRRSVVKLGLDLVECRLALTSVAFPTADDIDEYLDTFGIYAGMDLPLGLRPSSQEENRVAARRVLSAAQYPFSDDRVFLICRLVAR